ncbi:hypothetical protein GQ53DRAFT_649735 [Thozetella sp. PMI_491]|nr:hypothetical protein GQ53DRAFT_649735 [Thozetella sp. PMI_491]
MSSAYAYYPPSVVDSTRPDRVQEPRNVDGQPHHVHQADTGAVGHLSPYSSFHVNSNNASPVLNENTPAESVSTLSVNYQSSEFSEAGDDPFFGVDFDNVNGHSPAFLEPDFVQPETNHQTAPAGTQFAPNKLNVGPDGAVYRPISPDQTPSLHTSSPQTDRKTAQAAFQQYPESISPQQLAKPPRQALAVSLDFSQPTQLTPDTSGSGQSSDDGLAPAALVMPAQSPRVTVSYWGKDETEVQFSGAVAHHNQGGLITSAPRDDGGRWVPNAATGHGGLDPEHRPTTEVPSMNELAANRKVEERNQEVGDWLASAKDMMDPNAAQPPRLMTSEDPDGITTREIALGHETENNPREGQTYFIDKGGEVTEQDVGIMRSDRNWADAPILFPIYRPDDANGSTQPLSSQGAIERFERMCKDNESVVSRAATWGTRRRSLPSISDIEGITSGNFLKKLSLSRGDSRRPSILKELRGRLTKMPSSTFKRSRPEQEDDLSTPNEPAERKEGLAPPNRSLSWGKRAPTPSINTAFVAMGSNMASIGATHARSGSISTPITSPKSPSGFSLSVKKPLNRIRSKSDISKTGSGLADMWKKTGGPPVASLPKSAGADLDDDDDDDDDLYEDADMKGEATKLIDEIKPNMDGFREHILKLNPMLAGANNYLVDRIAYHQIQRYKHLLNNKVKHLKYNATGTCPSGTLCIAQGGTAQILDVKGDPRMPDPLSARFEGSDGDMTPLEGAITQESFPQDIPMPPTATLPAEFECQLCFSTKKFQKPSDWTKHVHEDVQPFTCTWEKCREPKMFKRKADWVRHENEGHRHLEWWTCDVEDCRHICYRRDNFLQHLVREHKFAEPRVKTKAAIKRAGGADPTWQKVERCHAETTITAKDEPCRFCGKEFPTWKKLTVHLAKHMEQISLPILRLVARADLDAETIISPVQDPPPRPFTATFPVKQEPQGFTPSPASAHTPVNRQAGHLAFPNAQPSQFMFQPMVQDFPGMYNYPDMSHAMAQQGLAAGQMHNVQQVPPGYPSLNTQGFGGMPVGTYITSPNSYISVAPDTESFPAMTMNALGLQDPAAGHMQYNMMDPSSAVSADQYTPQGSVSPFSHSPNQGQGNFYSQ